MSFECQQRPTLEYFGDNVRSYHDEWEWDRIYTINWEHPDQNYPTQLLWNITERTIAHVDLPLNETSMRVSFGDLTTAFCDGSAEFSKCQDDVRKSAASDKIDNRLLVTQDSKPDAIFFGPRFALVDKRAKMARIVGDGANEPAYSGASDDDKNWGSKFVVQRQRQGPGGIEKDAITFTANLVSDEKPTPTGTRS
ncbi:hypothetical protein LEL_05672 [Akanthomyces lecanii RCEF 1005]|uniref:Uncharacterized protein n=1 Tax=Akanthomyces lecanii RCEF 1005 TaxID=1081108 RepID=A0A162KJT7_CORDF|nr:hypothetical protein LEL_05672 [Akanthomyces lecanii RCEF 1005]